MDDQKKIRFRVGIVVIATFLITGLLVAWIADQPFDMFKKKYQVAVDLPQAPGVAIGTPVRKNGVLIGRVERVDLKDDGVIVVLQIDEDRHIRASEVCRVSASILGDAILEFVPGQEQNDAILKNGDSIQGVVRANPLDIIANLEGDFSKTISSLGNAGTEVASVAKKLNTMLDKADTERLARILAQTEEAMGAFTRTMNGIDKIMGDEELQAQLRQGVQDLPKLISDARDTMASVQQAVETADANLKSLQGLTEPLGNRGEQIAESLESAADNLDQLLGQVAKFTKSINNSDGTVGQLVHSSELYDKVNSILSDAQKLTKKLRPIVNDVRVFSDKIARDPSRLGVRGAIRRSTPIK